MERLVQAGKGIEAIKKKGFSREETWEPASCIQTPGAPLLLYPWFPTCNFRPHRQVLELPEEAGLEVPASVTSWDPYSQPVISVCV